MWAGVGGSDWPGRSSRAGQPLGGRVQQLYALTAAALKGFLYALSCHGVMCLLSHLQRETGSTISRVLLAVLAAGLLLTTPAPG